MPNPLLMKQITFPIIVCLGLCLGISDLLTAQQEQSRTNPYVSYEVPFQNLLKFNRFLVNPTFSTVRENKSYINFFHRNEASDFQDNHQDYFLSYSGRIDDRNGLGFSIYNQREGVITNIGAMVNYAYGIRLASKSVLTFGLNIPYYQSSFDRNRAVVTQDDPMLGDLEETSILAVQPGLNLAIGAFDFGIFAENLVDYSLKDGEMLTAFRDKTFSAHLQYTASLGAWGSLMEEGRLMPLLRVRKVGEGKLNYGGGMILDLPKLGWLQGGYDSYYGASVGAGFNLNRRLSLGYTIEKGLSGNLDNFGTTHEISLAFSFRPNLTEAMVYKTESLEPLEHDNPASINEESDAYALLLKKYETLEAKYEANNRLLEALVFQKDSLEDARLAEAERRYEFMMRSLKRDMETKSDSAASMQNNTAIADTGNDRARDYADPRDLVIRKMPKIAGLEEGHYVIANVFQTEKYLQQFMDSLREKGLKPGFFKNPENGLNYVYLAHYENDAPAREAYLSGLEGQYRDRTWIMHVESSRYSNMANLKFDEE